VTWHNSVVERRKKDLEAADDLWSAYFSSIQSVCPWSLHAYMRNKIKFIDYNKDSILVWSAVFASTDYSAFIYLMPKSSSEDVAALATSLERFIPTSEFLWSHPSEGGHSTPEPCIIQQDRGQLQALRDRLGVDYS
jgi:hypothetical protein